jgi:hypothetical protein
MVRLTGTSRVAYGDVAGVDSAAALTVALWLVPGSFVSAGGLLGKYTGLRIINYPGSGQFAFQDYGSGAYGAPTASQFPPGELHHAGFVFDGSLAAAERIKIYKDAAPVAMTISGTVPAALSDGGANVLRVGYEEVTAALLTTDLAYLRVWLAALSASELAAELQSHWPLRTANLVLDVPGDDGILCTDYSPLRNAVTITGTPTTPAQGPPVAFGAAVLVC